MKLTHIAFACLLIIACITGCKKDLPEAGSIADETPPSADFTFAQFSPDNFLEVTFSNLSESATDFEWEFGDGNTSTELEPVHIYDAAGTYTVTLTASDKLNATSTLTQDITLTEPSAFIPPILESGFEDGQLADGAGDGRDSWKNADLGGIIQITSDPVVGGIQAAKIPGDVTDQRIGYQLLTVTPNTTYDVKFNYTMLESPAGFLNVSILDGAYTNHEEALLGVIGSITVNDQSNSDAYVQATVTFNSGENSEIAIYFYNEGSVEARLDDFSINIGEDGTIPPSASFSFEENADDIFQIDFTNNSLNSTSYMWNFGDGNTSTDANPSNVYASAGVYTVSLVASNADGIQDTFSTDITVAAPAASFTAAENADDFLQIEFTNTSVNTDSYSWDFGDGNTSIEENPTHIYDATGTYEVVLTATNSVAALDDQATSVITVENPAGVSIANPSFDNAAVQNDNRIEWRNEALEASGDIVLGDGSYVLQMSTTSRTGANAGKLPTAENSGTPQRWLYQVIDVDANTNYSITGWIRNKAAGVGSNINFAIYDAPFDDAAVVGDANFILASQDYNDATGHDTNEWTEATIQFNSGDNAQIVLFITNDFTLTEIDSESFLDDFSISVQ